MWISFRRLSGILEIQLFLHLQGSRIGCLSLAVFLAGDDGRGESRSGIEQYSNTSGKSGSLDECLVWIFLSMGVDDNIGFGRVCVKPPSLNTLKDDVDCVWESGKSGSLDDECPVWTFLSMGVDDDIDFGRVWVIPSSLNTLKDDVDFVWECFIPLSLLHRSNGLDLVKLPDDDNVSALSELSDAGRGKSSVKVSSVSLSADEKSGGL